MSEFNRLIEKLDNIKKDCKNQSSKNKLSSVKRNLISLKELLDRVYTLSNILNSEKEVEWFYDRFRELKRDVKR